MRYKILTEEQEFPLFQIYFIVRAMASGIKRYVGFGLNNSLTIIRKGNLIFSVIEEEYRKEAYIILEKIKKDPNLGRKIGDNTLKACKEQEKTAEEIKEMDLSDKTDKEIGELYIDILDKFYETYCFGMVVPYLELAHAVLSDYVKDLLRKKIKDIDSVFMDLISTTKLTKMGYEKVGLIDIVKEIKKNKELNELFGKDIQSIKDGIGRYKINKKIEEHHKKYCWISHGYIGSSLDKDYFLMKIKDILKKEPKQEKKFKIDVSLDQHEKDMIDISRIFSFTKAERKDSIFYTSYCIRGLQKEVGKRLGITEAMVWQMIPDEIKNAFFNNQIDRDDIKKRTESVALLTKGEDFKILTGNDVDELEKSIIREEVDENIKEIKGVCANKGQAKGAVKIIIRKEDINKVNKGNILVSVETTPNMVSAMEKASAIITDVGGITCHAAVVSRELGIPCVIGTKIATKVLKDEEIVEVDADKGVIRRIE